MRRAIIVGLLAISSFYANAQFTTSSVYLVKNGQVIFRDWDSRNTMDPESLAELGIQDFPGAIIYSDRLLLTEKPASSKVIKVPDGATTFAVTARARQVGNLFPRIRISLIEDRGRTHELFNGYWQSVPLETYRWAVPLTAQGKSAKIKIEILNPGTVEEQRCWYFLRANFY